MVVLTHGKENVLYGSDDKTYATHELWEPFTADNCKSLGGKPKLFFIQVRQGSGSGFGSGFAGDSALDG